MNTKSFSDQNNDTENQKDINSTNKSLNTDKMKSNRVDINVLKSKLEDEQNKEFKKNILIFSLFAFILGSVGIYLSL